MTIAFHKSGRFRTLSLVLIFVAALALRLTYMKAGAGGALQDTDAYRVIAGNILEGKGYTLDGSAPTAYRAPGYVLFITLVEWVFGGAGAVLWIQCLLGASVALMAALIARNIAGDLFAPVAALAVAVDPFQIGVCSQLMSEAFFMFLATGAVFLLVWSLRTRRAERYLVAGLAAGVAAITRPEFLLFIPGALAVAALWGRRRRKFLCIAALVFGAALPVGLWGARNRRAMGEWIFTTTHGGYTHLLSYNERFHDGIVAGPFTTWGAEGLEYWQAELAAETRLMGEAERDRYYYEKAGEFIAERPFAAFRTALYGAMRFWRPFPHDRSPLIRFTTGVYFVVLLALAVGGFFVAWRRRPVPVLILYIFAFETCVHMYYWSNLRMRIPFHPLLAVLAAVGVAALFGRRAFVGAAIALPEEDPLYSPAV
jgi:4-amino-4-deoxy-L-arabinose transferase-like glycosyltransferase